MALSIDLRHVRSLTDFLRNHREHVQRLRESALPEILTVNGRPELVLQSAEAYQELLDRLDHAEGVAGLRKAYAQVLAGETQDLVEGIAGIRTRHGL